MVSDLCFIAADGRFSISSSEAKISSMVALKSFSLEQTQRKGRAVGKEVAVRWGLASSK